MKVIVIGGGPAGMLAAITAAENNNKVILLEKMSSLGRKLLITGKGRCNITSSLNMSEFIKNTPGNGVFLNSAYNQYTNDDIIEFLAKQGLKVKEERGNRIFPVTDKSVDVLNCFIKRLKELKVEIRYNENVKSLIIDENIMNGEKNIIGVKTKESKYFADKVILATGGKSYPLTGSTGDGYKMLEEIGHHIETIRPSLVPFEIYEKNIYSNLQGLSLRNVEIKVKDNTKNKLIYTDMGEMIFTHYGVSGPIILSGSAHLVRYKAINEKFKNKNIILEIDLKPALSEKKLDDRILRDFEENKNKQFRNSLDKLLPQKMIPVVIEQTNIDQYKKVNEITKDERHILIKVLKNFKVTLKNFRPIDEAIITSGGVKIKEINPTTMESKIVKNLYIAGEILDVDSYTGGFNLQIAYSTGYVAGKLI